jgi:hypothetical protein
VVLDYKTDAVDINSISDAVRRYRPQLAIYALLARRHFGVDTIRGVLLFARVPDDPVEEIFGAAVLDRFEAEISGLLGRIKAGDFAPYAGECAACPIGRDRCREIVPAITS